MSRWVVYLAGIVLIAAAVVGAANVSTRSEICMLCHTQQAEFAQWMKQKLKAEKKGFSHELISCSACHIKGAASGTMLSGLRGLLHAVTYLVPQIDPREPLVANVFKTTHVPREGCQYCHLGSLYRQAVWIQDLPDRLKIIGLAMDHRKHVLTSEKTCAKCHERYKDNKESTADKGVNYAEVNHLNCVACHTSASHAYRTHMKVVVAPKELKKDWQKAWVNLSENPRWMVAFPTEETCRRCHNGKIHYKTRIFLADCTNGKNYEDCLKCHPRMTKAYFKEHRRKSRKESASRTNRPANQRRPQS